MTSVGRHRRMKGKLVAESGAYRWTHVLGNARNAFYLPHPFCMIVRWARTQQPPFSVGNLITEFPIRLRTTECMCYATYQQVGALQCNDSTILVVCGCCAMVKGACIMYFNCIYIAVSLASHGTIGARQTAEWRRHVDVTAPKGTRVTCTSRS